METHDIGGIESSGTTRGPFVAIAVPSFFLTPFGSSLLRMLSG